MRNKQTIKINSGLRIIKLNNQRFLVPGGYTMPRGYCFHHSELGYFAFDGNLPYRPIGGRIALQSILNDGGFLAFDGCKWIKEFKEV